MNNYAMGGLDERKGLGSALLSDDQQGGLDSGSRVLTGPNTACLSQGGRQSNFRFVVIREP